MLISWDDLKIVVFATRHWVVCIHKAGARGRDKDDSGEEADQHEGEDEEITLEERQLLIKLRRP
jgi:hypothetical protein